VISLILIQDRCFVSLAGSSALHGPGSIPSFAPAFHLSWALDSCEGEFAQQPAAAGFRIKLPAHRTNMILG
jgi:hypothetical protein